MQEKKVPIYVRCKLFAFGKYTLEEYVYQKRIKRKKKGKCKTPIYAYSIFFWIKREYTPYDTRTVQYFHVSSLLYKRFVQYTIHVATSVSFHTYLYKYISWRSSIFFSCQLTAQRRRTQVGWNFVHSCATDSGNSSPSLPTSFHWICISIHTKKSVCCLSLPFYSNNEPWCDACDVPNISFLFWFGVS